MIAGSLPVMLVIVLAKWTEVNTGAVALYYLQISNESKAGNIILRVNAASSSKICPG